MQCQALGCLGRLAGGLEPFAVSLAQHQQVRFRWFKDKVENRSDFTTETWIQGVTRRCRLSLLTNSALVCRVQMQGEGKIFGSQPMSAAVHIT
jgi:hypothetical protein